MVGNTGNTKVLGGAKMVLCLIESNNISSSSLFRPLCSILSGLIAHAEPILVFRFNLPSSSLHHYPFRGLHKKEDDEEEDEFFRMFALPTAGGRSHHGQI